MGFIRLCTPQMETDTGSLLDRVHILEQKIAEGIPVQSAGPGGYGAAGPGTGGMGGSGAAYGSGAAGNGSMNGGSEDSLNSSENAANALKERFSPAEAADLKAIASSWNTIVAQTAMPMQKFLQAARIAVSEDSSIIQLVFERDDIEKNYFERNHQHNLGILSDIVAEQTGKRVKFECSVHNQETGGQPSSFIDLSKIHQTVIFE